MKWSEIRWQGQPAGLLSESDHLVLFFGFGHFPKSELAPCFTEFDFFHLRQVHGPTLIEASHEAPEADAHFSLKRGQALVIQTADCLPVLIGGRDFVLAAHAGWRGVASDLLVFCARWITEKNLCVQRAVIGPHIQAKNFEVGEDVAKKLGEAAQRSNPLLDPVLPHLLNNKAYVDLSLVAQHQLRFGLSLAPNIEDLGLNTYEDLRFQSFRRGAVGQGRQYSFIARR